MTVFPYNHYIDRLDRRTRRVGVSLEALQHRGPVGFHGSVDGLCGFGESWPISTQISVIRVFSVSTD